VIEIEIITATVTAVNDGAPTEGDVAGCVNNFGLGWIRQGEEAYSCRTRRKGVSIELMMNRLGKLRGYSGGPFHGSSKTGLTIMIPRPDAGQSNSLTKLQSVKIQTAPLPIY
jgi:hypothetical protein